jgi:uncharacterized damage-inducible protein DinB
MDLIEHYRQLARYDGWANLEVVRSLRASGTPPAKSVKWLAHIVAAEYVWLTRLRSEPQPLPVWPELSLEQSEEEFKKLAAAWPAFLAAGRQLEGAVSYKNSKGEPWTNSVADILTHVFMHSAYHRGQIAADMRQAGHTPAYTDFIHGVRQGLVE